MCRRHARQRQHHHHHHHHHQEQNQESNSEEMARAHLLLAIGRLMNNMEKMNSKIE